MENRYKIMNTFVDALSMEETIQKVEKIIEQKIPSQHVVINANKVNLIEHDPELQKIINSCPIINADGASILWAAKVLGLPVSERVTGCDLFLKLVELSEDKGYKIFLFGAKEEVVKKVKDIFEQKYPSINIVGYRNGYFKESDEAEIVKQIADSKADMLFVAFPSPKKEYWINKYLKDLHIPFVAGVGGSFDIVAGVTERAPIWWQDHGLEWMYRFLQEPRRMWKRYILGNFKFASLVYKYKIKSLLKKIKSNKIYLKEQKMINVIGLGYIGLPTALMLASHGNEVVGTDLNEKLISTLNSGKTTFKEEGLDDLFKLAVDKGIKFTTKYQNTNTYVVSVPTPYDAFSKKIDSRYVISAVTSILEVCSKGATIIIESTVSPGTMEKSVCPAIKSAGYKIGEDINIVHAPERIIPGNMVYELIHNSRTIGAYDKEVGKKVKKMYKTFCKGDIVVTDVKTAEMTKVVENTFRAVNIAFANELAKICRHDGMDVYEIINICNMHPRVNILQPGPGVGGHCIPVDPWFLVGDYPSLTNVINESMKVNASMPDFVLNRIHEIMKEKEMKDFSKVGLYGLTYKENVDDLRESPTLQLLESQNKHLANGLKVYDPFIKENIVENQYFDLDKFINDCEIIVIMVKHDEIVEKQEILSNKIVLDCQNIIKKQDVYKI